MSFDEETRDDKCVNCLDIKQEIKIKCKECPGDMLLCLECFSNGVELGRHKRTHNYSLYDPGCFPLLTQDWSGADELQLLEALEEFGFGDWAQCTTYLSSKSTSEIHSHFEEFYLCGILAEAVKDLLRDPASKPCSLSPSLTVAPMRVEITKQEGVELGYMPKRDDFEREYDNTAEELISKLVATHNDEPIEAELKFAQVQIYNKRLKDRALRKKIGREYGLVSSKHASTVLRGKKLDQRELRSKLVPFGRFMTYNQFEKLACGITKEHKLRSKIQELKSYRRNGVCKMEDGREFEVDKMKREKRKREEQIGNTPPKRLSYNSLRTLGTDSKIKVEHAFDTLAGFKSLSEHEKELCSALQLAPQKYITAKMSIINKEMGSSCAMSVDISHTDKLRITEYLKSAGFISLVT